MPYGVPYKGRLSACSKRPSRFIVFETKTALVDHRWKRYCTIL